MKHLLYLALALSAAAARAQSPADTLPPLDDVLPKEVNEEALFAHWPSIEEVLAETMRALPPIVGRDSTWRTRQHLAPFLPTLRLGSSITERNFNRNVVERDPNNHNRLNDFRLDDGVRDYDYQAVYVEWDISEILFDDDELEIAAVQRNLTDFRLQIQEEVMRAYYGLKEATLILAQNLVTNPEERTRVKMNAEHNQAILDVYTRGFFSEALR